MLTQPGFPVPAAAASAVNHPNEVNSLFSDKIFSLLATAEFGAYAVSVDQTIVFWNQGAQRILGYTPDQVVGRHCYDVVSGVVPGGLSPECREGCPSIRCLRAGTVPGALELQVLCASGERKLVSLTPMVVAGERDDAPLLVHLFDDSPEEGTSDRAADSVRDQLSRVGADVVTDQPAAPPAPASAHTLSPRELEVLRLVSLGWSTPRIASDLGISPHTVRNHIRHFRHKLNATTKLEAVLTAMRMGMLT